MKNVIFALALVATALTSAVSTASAGELRVKNKGLYTVTVVVKNGGTVLLNTTLYAGQDKYVQFPQDYWKLTGDVHGSISSDLLKISGNSTYNYVELSGTTVDYRVKKESVF